MRQIFGDEDTSMKFDTLGGSDAPHFCLKLTHKPNEQTAMLCFIFWTRKQPPRADQRRVHVYTTCPTESFAQSFNLHLIGNMAEPL